MRERQQGNQAGLQTMSLKEPWVQLLVHITAKEIRAIKRSESTVFQEITLPKKSQAQTLKGF